MLRETDAVLDIKSLAKRFGVSPQVLEKATRALGTRELDNVVIGDPDGEERSLTKKDIELIATHGGTD